jgi:multicomponent Na+:H+ antiporter subunit E
MADMEVTTDNRQQRYLLVFVVSFLFWLLLTASFDPQELIAGLLVSGVVALVTASRLEVLSGIRWSSAALPAVVRFLGVFTVALFKANLDMARRVLSPSLPIQPALVEVKTGLRSDLGKLLLANSITLTPGTLAIDIVDDRLLVHWIDSSPGSDLESATREIVSRFETHLRGFLR